MAQGYTGYSLFDSNVTIKDSANLDAFSRLRMSNPITLFSSQLTYNSNPLLFEKVTGPNGGNIFGVEAERYLRIELQATGTSKSYIQSYEYIPYQPSKSQLVFVTFNFVGPPGNSGVTKFAGLSDGINGVELQISSTYTRFAILTGSSSGGTQYINKGSWNIDRFDGTGPSGITIDFTKCQILVIDFQALYVGRVRFGFDINGQIYYAHAFNNANNLVAPYFQTANLPIRVGMTSTASTGASTEYMFYFCSAVVSEGGTEDSNLFGYNFAASSGLISGFGTTTTHALSIRPRTDLTTTSAPKFVDYPVTITDFTSRIKIVLQGLEIINTGAKPLKWNLAIGYGLTGATFNKVNQQYSSVDYAVGSGVTLANTPIIINSGYIASGGFFNGVTDTSISSRYPITLNAAGAVRDLGTATVTLETLGSTGTTDAYVTLKYKEIR